jgi:hypothetical protein
LHPHSEEEQRRRFAAATQTQLNGKGAQGKMLSETSMVVGSSISPLPPALRRSTVSFPAQETHETAARETQTSHGSAEQTGRSPCMWDYSSQRSGYWDSAAVQQQCRNPSMNLSSSGTSLLLHYSLQLCSANRCTVLSLLSMEVYGCLPSTYLSAVFWRQRWDKLQVEWKLRMA